RRIPWCSLKACATGSLDFARDDQELTTNFPSDFGVRRSAFGVRCSALAPSPMDIGRRWTFGVCSASIPQRIHPLPDDAIDQLWIGQACLTRGLRKIFILGQDWIRICLDKIDFVFRR